MVMMKKYDRQILVRIQEGWKELINDLATEEYCTIPQWVRNAIIEKVERDLDVKVNR
jgi:predicted HicB family RNase H-like nuclease